MHNSSVAVICMRQRMLWIYHYLDYNFICNEIYRSEHLRYSPQPPRRNHFYYSLDWVSALPGWSIKTIAWGSFSYFCWVSGQEACLCIMTCMCVYRRGGHVCAVPRERPAVAAVQGKKYSQSHQLRSFQKATLKHPQTFRSAALACACY